MRPRRDLPPAAEPKFVPPVTPVLGRPLEKSAGRIPNADVPPPVPSSFAVGTTVATLSTDDAGAFRFPKVKPGIYQRRAQVPGGRAWLEGGRLFYVTADMSDDARTKLASLDWRLAPFKKGTWRHFTHLHGLPNNIIFAMQAAGDGTLWLGTAGGLARFDGEEFTVFNKKNGLLDPDIYAMHETPDGSLWLGTRHGLSRLNPRTGEVKNWTKTDGLTGGTLFAIASDSSGTLWLGKEGGLSRFDGRTFRNFTEADGVPSRIVSTLWCDPAGPVWAGGDKGFSDTTE